MFQTAHVARFKVQTRLEESLSNAQAKFLTMNDIVRNICIINKMENYGDQEWLNNSQPRSQHVAESQYVESGGLLTPRTNSCSWDVLVKFRGHVVTPQSLFE